MRKITLSIITLFAFILGTYAQEEEEQKVKTGYNFGVLPAISYNTDLGFQYGLLTNIYDYGDGSNYPQYRHSLYAEVSRFTKGSGIYRIFYDSEFLVPEIRLTADLSYLPTQALQFFGFNGYDAIYNKSFENDQSAAYISRMYYRHQRNTFRFKLDLQGNLAGNLNWVAGYSYINTSISTVPIDKLNKGKEDDKMLPDTALLYDKYVDWGVINAEVADGGSHHNIKLGLVYDTRDNEACPMSGIWSEVVLLNSFGSDTNFGKLSVMHRQYFTIIPKDLSFAYRLGYQGNVWGEMPFYMAPYMVYSYMPSSNMDGLGGSKTMRGMMLNRLVAKSVAFANVELRWKFSYFQFLNQNCYLAASPFVDLGRTIQKMDIDLSNVPDAEKDDHFADDNEKVHMTYGAGLHFAMNQNFVVAADVGLPINEQDGAMGVYIGMNWLF